MANRSKIMGLHGLKNKPRRNGFDLSHRNLFTAKVGELLPCAVFELNPGDTIKLDSSYFTRTAPVQTAAFTRLRENVQFFFVPYSQLWKYFDTQVLNMTKTAAGGDVSRVASDFMENQAVTTQMPYVNYKAIHKYLLSMANSEDVSTTFLNNGEYRWSASAKLLQMLGYGDFTPEMNLKQNSGTDLYDDSKLTNSPNLSIFRLLAYQKICNDHYTYRQWQPYNASLCNVDYLKPSATSALDISDKLTATSGEVQHNDKYNMFDLRFSNLPLDYFNGVLPTAQYGSESVVSLSGISGLDVKKAYGLTSKVQGIPLKSLTLGSDVTLPYNPIVATSSAQIDGKADLYFQDNGLGQKTGQINVGDGSFLKSLSATEGWIDFDGSKSSLEFVTDVNGGSQSSAELSIVALRNAVALQRYKEIQLANDVDFVSQIEAHFGVKPKCSDTVSRFIGGASSMIDINPQINQNLVDENQATLKAAPVGNGAAHMKFTADTYGVVMGIYRCTPVLDYAHIGIDRTLFKTDAADFVIPELDSVGMQQTFLCEIAAPAPTSTYGLTKSFDFTKTYGYAPRYSEYKTSFDRYNGDFCLTLNSWVTGLNPDILKYHVFSDDDTTRLAPEMFNCRPDIVKSIFLNQETKLVSDDVLYVGLVNIAFATRNLSVYGLPYSH